MRCTDCKTRLQTIRSPSGLRWACGQCGGQAMAPGWLRSAMSKDFLRRFWTQAREGEAGPRDCPSCGRAMVVLSPTPAGALEVDACSTCRIVWFDPDEVERMIATDDAKPTADTTPVADGTATDSVPLDRHLLRKGLALVGFPIVQGRPLLTWALAAAMLASLMIPEDVRSVMAFGPDAPLGLSGLTWVSSILAHQSWPIHAFQLWLLLIVGDNVEDTIGPLRFAGLVLLTTAGANLAWMVLGGPAPHSGAVPAVWAMASFYLCMWPQARVGLNVFGHWVGERLLGFLIVVPALVCVGSAFGWLGSVVNAGLPRSAVQNASRSLPMDQTISVLPIFFGIGAGVVAWLLHRRWQRPATDGVASLP